MQNSADQSLVRSTNQRAILTAIYNHQTTSRADLARELSMSKPAIADNLNLLLSIGIVEEVGEGEASKAGGRKPILIRFNRNFKYIIAIDLNFKDPIFALVNLRGEILNEFSIKVSKCSFSKTRVDLIKNAIDLLLNSKNIQADQLAYIAISSPGVFLDTKSLSFANQQFAEWFQEDIFSALSTHYHTHVIIKNDANTAAIGELYYGAGTGAENLLYISCGMGIGTGIVLGSKLFEGKYSAAGEIFNNIDVDKYSRSINLESIVSINAILKRSREEVEKGQQTYLSSINPDIMEFEHIIEAYKQHDSFIIELLNNISTEIGCVISNITNLLTIDTVVLGGEYLVFSDLFISKINEITNHYCHFPPKIAASSLGKHVGIMGLFAISREMYFDLISKRDNY